MQSILFSMSIKDTASMSKLWRSSHSSRQRCGQLHTPFLSLFMGVVSADSNSVVGCPCCLSTSCLCSVFAHMGPIRKRNFFKACDFLILPQSCKRLHVCCLLGNSLCIIPAGFDQREFMAIYRFIALATATRSNGIAFGIFLQ